MPEMDRFHRQKLLPGWGEDGQARVGEAHALVVGVGALWCVSADLLVRAGVGRVTLVDRDVVEWTNLQRQTLYVEVDARDGRPKAVAASERLGAVNSGVEIEPVVADFDARNAVDIAVGGRLGRADVIIDGLDSFETRYLLNDLAVREGVPYFYAGAVGRSGMGFAVIPSKIDQGRPCLRCLFPEPAAAGTQPTCDNAGVLGPLIAVVAGWQAGSALEWLASGGERFDEGLMRFDLQRYGVRRVSVDGARDAGCVCCGERSFEFLDGTRASSVATLCGRDAVQIGGGGSGARVDLQALGERLGSHGDFEATRFLVRGVLQAEKGDAGAVGLTVFADGRAMVQGVADLERARAIYARYVGH